MRNDTLSFDEAIEHAQTVVGPCTRAQLWLVLSKWAREGRAIDTLACRALIASVVGKAAVPEFIRCVKAAWCKE